MNLQQTAHFTALLMHGVHPGETSYLAGFRKKASTPAYGPAGAKIARFGANILAMGGLAGGAPWFHLRSLAEAPQWHPKYKEASDLVLESMREQQIKSAAVNPVDLLARLAEKTVIGSAVGGGTLGALYFLLNRDITQDAAKVQAKEEQARLYEDWARNLDRKLRGKYQYGEKTDQGQFR